MKLIEGNRYNFNVEKTVSLLETEFFLLIGPNQYKYLLNTNDYTHYKISVGDMIDCRVDKINCQGEIFLEPKHPYYNEGETYKFLFDHFATRIDKDGEKVNVIILKDRYNKDVVVPAIQVSETLSGKKSHLKLTVKRIFKGVVRVASETFSEKFEKKEESTVHKFLLLEESLGVDGKYYYVAENSSGELFTLAKEYYSHYKMKKGSYFLGKYIRYRNNSELSIEPLNPYFETAKAYNFTVKELIKIHGSVGYILLTDEHGFTHKTDYFPGIKEGQKLKFKVERIRKGLPLLQAINNSI